MFTSYTVTELYAEEGTCEFYKVDRAVQANMGKCFVHKEDCPTLVAQFREMYMFSNTHHIPCASSLGDYLQSCRTHTQGQWNLSVWTPLGRHEVSLIVRCPDFRGCKVHKQGVWDSQTCPVMMYIICTCRYRKYTFKGTKCQQY